MKQPATERVLSPRIEFRTPHVVRSCASASRGIITRQHHVASSRGSITKHAVGPSAPAAVANRRSSSRRQQYDHLPARIYIYIYICAVAPRGGRPSQSEGHHTTSPRAYHEGNTSPCTMRHAYATLPHLSTAPSPPPFICVWARTKDAQGPGAWSAAAP